MHEIVFHGKGGYDYNIIYNMPIWLRNFTFHKINEFYEKENKMYEDAKKGNKTTVIDPQGQVKAPEFIKKTKVNYNKEASQK